MWILWNFLEHLFYGTPLDDCFCDLHFESKILVHFQINILSQNVCSQAIYWVSQKFWKKNGLCDFLLPFASYIWDNVFKNEPSKICGRQPLKNLKWYGLYKQTMSLQIFQTLSSTSFTWSILEYFVSNTSNSMGESTQSTASLWGKSSDFHIITGCYQ